MLKITTFLFWPSDVVSGVRSKPSFPAVYLQGPPRPRISRQAIRQLEEWRIRH